MEIYVALLIFGLAVVCVEVLRYFSIKGQAKTLLRIAQSDNGRSVTPADVEKALRRKKWLGFGYLNDREYTDIVVLAARDFQYPSNLSYQCTWPEFIIATAYTKDCVSGKREIANRTQLLYVLITVGGPSRVAEGLNAYLTWDGWKPL